MENKKTKNVKKYKTKNVIKLNLIKHIFFVSIFRKQKKKVISKNVFVFCFFCF